MGVSEYLQTANESILVMIQIENKEAVESVEQIASVEGIGLSSIVTLLNPSVRLPDGWLVFSDVLFIGPYDLSISLGYPLPSPDPHPEVEKSIKRILDASHAAGKKWQVTLCDLTASDTC